MDLFIYFLEVALASLAPFSSFHFAEGWRVPRKRNIPTYVHKSWISPNGFCFIDKVSSGEISFSRQEKTLTWPELGKKAKLGFLLFFPFSFFI